MPAPVYQLLYCTTVLSKVVHCKIENVLVFCVCLLFTYYLCGKYYKPVTVQYYITDCVSWVPRLTLWDIPTNWTERMHSRNRTHLCVGELLEMEGNIALSTQDSLDPGFKLFTPSPLSVCLTPSQLTWSSESESEIRSDVSDSS